MWIPFNCIASTLLTDAKNNNNLLIQSNVALIVRRHHHQQQVNARKIENKIRQHQVTKWKIKRGKKHRKESQKCKPTIGTQRGRVCVYSAKRIYKLCPHSIASRSRSNAFVYTTCGGCWLLTQSPLLATHELQQQHLAKSHIYTQQSIYRHNIEINVCYTNDSITFLSLGTVSFHFLFFSSLEWLAIFFQQTLLNFPSIYFPMIYFGMYSCVSSFKMREIF